MDNTQHLQEIIENSTGRDPSQIIISLAKNLTTASISVIAGLLASRIANQMEQRTEAGGQSIIGASMSALIYPHIDRLIDQLASSIMPFSDNKLYKCHVVFQRIVAASETVVKRLPETTQAAINEIDKDIAASLTALMQNQEPDHSPSTVKAIYDILLIRQAFWMGQARRCQNYMETVNYDLLKEAIELQQPHYQLIFRDVANAILASSLLGELDDTRPQFLFYGLSGVGKTFGLELLARALGAPLIFLHFETMKENDIHGEDWDYSIVHAPGKKGVLKIKGSLRSAVREAGVRNPIILIDEFSSVEFHKHPWKEALFKKLFNLLRADDDNDGLENLAHVVFLVLTNDRPEEIHPAIRSRFVECFAPELDDDRLAKIRDARLSTTINKLKSLTDANNSAQLGSVDPELLAEATLRTEELINKYKGSILQKNKDRGARTIQTVVRQLLTYILMEKIISKNPKYEPAADDIERLIEARSTMDFDYCPPSRDADAGSDSGGEQED